MKVIEIEINENGVFISEVESGFSNPIELTEKPVEITCYGKVQANIQNGGGYFTPIQK